MAGLLDGLDLSGYVGDDKTKDEFGQTQADRRAPLWSGLINAGLLAVAGGGNLMPSERAKYIAAAGGALGGIGTDMIQARSAAAQQALRGQEIKSKQIDLAQSQKWREYAESPEFQTAMDEAKASPAERMAAKAAALKGDFASVTKILDPRRNQPKPAANGDIIYPNGDIWNQLTGWKIKDGKPVTLDLGQNAPAPNENPQPEPGASPNAPYPSMPKQFPAPPGSTPEGEIAQWSNIKPTAGLPTGIKPSQFDEPRNYAALKGLDPGTARIVQQMGDYEMEGAKATGLRSNPDLVKLVDAYNPNWKPSQYQLINNINKAYATGDVGKSMLAMDTAYAHIGSLWKQYQVLNGPDTPGARAVLQEVQRRLGLPSTAGFDVARSAVADEVAKAMRGGGALNKDEQEDWQKKYNPTQSPEQFQRAVVETMELLEGKEKAIKNKYKTDTGLQRKDFLSSENKALAEHIRSNPVGGAKPAAAPTVSAYTGPDGATISMDQINETAKTRNMTPAQVIQALGLKPVK